MVRGQLSCARIQQGFERRELRRNSGFPDRTVSGFHVVGRVDFRIQLDGLHRRPLQPERFGPVSTLACPLHLQRPAKRLRVVL